MKLIVSSIDHAPEELYDQEPFSIRLLRELPGDDRSDYWLGELDEPLKWRNKKETKTITHVVLCARWAGTRIEPHVENIPINIAFVINGEQLKESKIDFKKSVFIAIGLATEIEGGNKLKPLKSIIVGNIAKAFGFRKKK